ncbi:MAG: tetratricopeptide repeat protein [Notoacmeibacter sp.]|nr:tetratricopeptide repeat protein [Notoacmeibacter sp.]
MEWLRQFEIDFGKLVQLLAGLAAIVGLLWAIAKATGWLLLRFSRKIAENRDPILSPGLLLPDGAVVGREDDIDRLHDLLWKQDRRSVAITPAVTVKGQGGIGKTTMARHYAKKYGPHYNGVWMIDAATPEQMISSFVELGRRLGIGDPAPAKDYARSVVGALGDRAEDWLLIFDNAWNPRQVREWTPDNARIRRLVTSREGGWGDGFTIFGAETLSWKQEDAPRGKLAPALDLLFKVAERAPGSELEEARALAADLGGLPLALVQIGVWLRDTGQSVAECRKRIETLLDQPIPEEFDYKDSVFAAVSLSLDRLEKDAADESLSEAGRAQAAHGVMIVKLFCWLAPEGLDAELLTDVPHCSVPNPQEFWDDIPGPVMALARDPGAVTMALSGLVRRSLLEARDGSFAMHRLIQAVARARLADCDWPIAAAALVAAGYPGGGAKSPQYHANWPRCARLTPHVSALAAHPPATAAMHYLFNQASIYLGEQRRDAEARRFAWASLKLTKARLSADHRKIAIVYSVLGARLKSEGRPRQAEILLRKAVAIAERNPAISDAVRAIILSNHGNCLEKLAVRAKAKGEAEKALGLFRRAGAQYRQALVLDIKTHGRQSDQVATRVNNLGTLRRSWGRISAALAAARRALAIWRAILPAHDPRLGLALNNLGCFLLEAGDAAEGIALLDEALRIRKSAFLGNPRHPDIVATARWLGAGLLMRGEAADRARAERLCGEYGFAVGEHERDAQMIKLLAVARAKMPSKTLDDFLAELDAKKAKKA